MSFASGSFIGTIGTRGVDAGTDRKTYPNIAGGALSWRQTDWEGMFLDLTDIRKRINMLDFEILKLLNSRMEYALRTKCFKASVEDLAREHEVIDYIQKHSQGLIEPEFCKNLFTNVISESKRLQCEDLKLIGFQGEHGAFGEVAARQFNRHLICISCAEFREVFDAVENGLLHYGVIPIESTLGGLVPDVNEFLTETTLKIVGEVKIPIRYCLMTLPEIDPREIRAVYSHPQVLSHCQGFLARRKVEGRPYYDCGAAARMLMRDRPEASAVIASCFAAEFYNMVCVEEGVEDHPGNFTRFLILSRDGEQVEGTKASLVFSTDHKAGALFEILREFADVEINLTKIESVPNRNDPGSYIFFLDFDGSTKDPVVLEVLERVKQRTRIFKFLGCYPAADNPA